MTFQELIQLYSLLQDHIRSCALNQIIESPPFIDFDLSTIWGVDASTIPVLFDQTVSIIEFVRHLVLRARIIEPRKKAFFGLFSASIFTVYVHPIPLMNVLQGLLRPSQSKQSSQFCAVEIKTDEKKKKFL